MMNQRAREFNTDDLRTGAKTMGLALHDEQLELLVAHLQMLQKWNRQINLTAITDPREMLVQHTLDSLSVAHLLQGQHILDVGSGGGFPGLPLATLLPTLSFDLLDARQKRVEFVRHVALTLGIANVQAHAGRIESYTAATAPDCILSRAFSSLLDFYQWTKHLHRPGLRLLAMKGRVEAAEIKQLREATTTRNVRIQVESLTVWQMPAERHAIVIDFE